MLKAENEYYILAGNWFDMLCVKHMTRAEACKKAERMVADGYWDTADVFNFYDCMVANYGYSREV